MGGVQKMILSRGDLTGEGDRNPTEELMKRINEETEKFHANPAAKADLSDVDKYLLEAKVEPHAACRLRELPWKQQQEVLSRGSLRTARDPTQTLVGFIADVTGGAPVTPAAQPPIKQPEPAEEDDEIDAVMK